MEFDIVSMAAGAIVSQAAGDVTSPVTAPFRAVADHWTEKVRSRLHRHVEAVDQLSGGEGAAPERVRIKAAVEAALTDDDVCHRYLAGVVAGATDDSPTSQVAVIGRLGAQDLRLHFVLYRELHRLLQGPDAPMFLNINDDFTLANFEVFLELEPLLASLGMAPGPAAVRSLLGSLRALTRENLVAPTGGHALHFTGTRAGFTVGSSSDLAGYLEGSDVTAPGEGAIVRPSVGGMSLMAWVFGADGTGDPATFRGLDAIPSPDGTELPPVAGQLVVNLQKKSDGPVG